MRVLVFAGIIPGLRLFADRGDSELESEEWSVQMVDKGPLCFLDLVMSSGPKRSLMGRLTPKRSKRPFSGSNENVLPL
ncbi:hypothetical protein GGR55DRAFT_625030 [Xylaria sp. FL0064]|nr:hypothetical protein GGR55DRAFT_666157 [Xylaria sp. FL0064]KAI0818424.1 hypothetical protein GGR55DRAFT_625030 [Xylaria sp. FL0064]